MSRRFARCVYRIVRRALEKWLHEQIRSIGETRLVVFPCVAIENQRDETCPMSNALPECAIAAIHREQWQSILR